MNSTRDDELVEEFRKAFEAYNDVCMDIQFGQDDRDVYVEQRAEHLIALTLKAVVDGMPLPGEVGRATLAWPNAHLQGWFLRMKNKIGQGAMFIALHPTGAGEEEVVA